MKVRDLIKVTEGTLATFTYDRYRPLFGTLIVTDRCNLSCRHCKLNRYADEPYTYDQILSDLKVMYAMGVRVLCFSGGEIGLWESDEHKVRHLVGTAREMGFPYVALATNGVISMDYGDTDLVFISIDGSKESHDRIRGESYDRILRNIREGSNNRIILYMTINRLNYSHIGDVCRLAKTEPNVRASSFNFHTPFEGTANLALDRRTKAGCLKEIHKYMDAGYPVLNLRSCFSDIARGTFPTPCRQMMVMDRGEAMICCRCIREKGLCSECGYFEAAEISLMFKGRIPVLMDALGTYGKYLF